MNERLKIIFEQVLSEVGKGHVEIETEDLGVWKFNVKFYHEIEGNGNIENRFYPVLKISNYEQFLNELEDYLKQAKQFFDFEKVDFDLNDESFEKMLISFLFTNATYYDFENPISFIKKRKEMIENEIPEQKIDLGTFFNEDVKRLGLGKLQIIGTVTKNHSSLETPYKFNIKFKDSNGEIFEMPHISFSVVDDKVYIYAVQTKKDKQNSPLANKLDWYFRKVNFGDDMDSMEGNVYPNAVVSMTLFMSYLKTMGVKYVEAPNYLPVRYGSNKITTFRKQTEFETKEDSIFKVYRSQANATNKFSYLFLRYIHHFPETEFNFDENQSTISLRLNESVGHKGNVVYELENIVFENSLEQKSK